MNIIHIKFILLIICIALLFIVLKKNDNKDSQLVLKQVESLTKEISMLKAQVSQGNADIAAVIRDEFSKSRMESAAAQSEQRKEVAGAITEMSTRLEKMTKDSFSFNMRMQEMISQKLDEINKRNEAKLEQMRLTVDEKLNEKEALHAVCEHLKK